MNTLLLACSLLVPVSAWAHGGGLDAQGCHTNRKTGDRHCHRTKAPPSPPASAQANSATVPSEGTPTCHVGPRGGTYTITKSGRKNYKGC